MLVPGDRRRTAVGLAAVLLVVLLSGCLSEEPGSQPTSRASQQGPPTGLDLTLEPDDDWILLGLRLQEPAELDARFFWSLEEPSVVQSGQIDDSDRNTVCAFTGVGPWAGPLLVKGVGPAWSAGLSAEGIHQEARVSPFGQAIVHHGPLAPEGMVYPEGETIPVIVGVNLTGSVQQAPIDLTVEADPPQVIEWEVMATGPLPCMSGLDDFQGGTWATANGISVAEDRRLHLPVQEMGYTALFYDIDVEHHLSYEDEEAPLWETSWSAVEGPVNGSRGAAEFYELEPGTKTVNVHEAAGNGAWIGGVHLDLPPWAMSVFTSCAQLPQDQLVGCLQDYGGTEET